MRRRCRHAAHRLRIDDIHHGCMDVANLGRVTALSEAPIVVCVALLMPGVRLLDALWLEIEQLHLLIRVS